MEMNINQDDVTCVNTPLLHQSSLIRGWSLVIVVTAHFTRPRLIAWAPTYVTLMKAASSQCTAPYGLESPCRERAELIALATSKSEDGRAPSSKSRLARGEEGHVEWAMCMINSLRRVKGPSLKASPSLCCSILCHSLYPHSCGPGASCRVGFIRC